MTLLWHFLIACECVICWFSILYFYEMTLWHFSAKKRNSTYSMTFTMMRSYNRIFKFFKTKRGCVKIKTNPFIHIVNVAWLWQKTEINIKKHRPVRLMRMFVRQETKFRQYIGGTASCRTTRAVLLLYSRQSGTAESRTSYTCLKYVYKG